MHTEIYIDKIAKEVKVAGELFYLSSSELLLLELLYINKGVTVSREQIYKECWPGRLVSPASLPVAIKHVRDIFKKISENKQIIITHKGIGYSFSTDSTIELIFSSSKDIEDEKIDKGVLELSHSPELNKSALWFSLSLFPGLLLFFWMVFTIMANKEPEDVTTVIHDKKQISFNLLYDDVSTVPSNDNYSRIFKDVNGSIIQCNDKECVEK